MERNYFGRDITYNMKNLYEQDIDHIAGSPMLQKLEEKTILITGATGMIGKYMIHVLQRYNTIYAKDKCKIIALCRSAEVGCALFGKDDNIEYIIADVCEPVQIQERIDYIVHAASNTNPSTYAKIPVETYRANVIGTENMLQLARKKHSEAALFISSASVYGNVSHGTLDENTCGRIDFFNINNSYSEGKRMGECICKSFFSEYGVPVKIARPFHMYGPGMRLDDGRLFDDLVNKVLNGKDIVLLSSGDKKRNFCYIRNSIELLFHILINGKAGEIYNVGSPNNSYTIKEFAQKLIEANDDERLRIIYNISDKIQNPSNVYDMIPNLNKIEKEITDQEIEIINLQEGLCRLLKYERN